MIDDVIKLTKRAGQIMWVQKLGEKHDSAIENLWKGRWA